MNRANELSSDKNDKVPRHRGESEDNPRDKEKDDVPDTPPTEPPPVPIEEPPSQPDKQGPMIARRTARYSRQVPHAFERRADHYAAGSEGTQQVTTPRESPTAGRDTVPPSPLHQHSTQPPVEPSE